MFGRKRRLEAKRAAEAARKSALVILGEKVAKLRGRWLAKEAGDKKAAAMSPSEKTKAQGNSTAERIKSTPSV